LLGVEVSKPASIYMCPTFCYLHYVQVIIYEVKVSCAWENNITHHVMQQKRTLK